MATVYSLIAWGGRTGKTVSLSASSDVVTLTNHGLRNGAKLWPSGTLPSELNTSTAVYARSTGSNSFTLHTSSAGAIANTGQILFAGASTYAAVVLKSDLVADPANALSPYGLSDLSRWGSSGSERIYDSINSFVTARGSVTTGFDIEHCEVGDAMWDYAASGFVLSLTNSPLTKYTATINGAYTPAKHNNILDNGYTLYGSSCSTGNNVEIYDLCFRPKDSGNNTYIIGVNGINVKIWRCCFYGWAKNGIGISLVAGGVGANIQYCLAVNLATGINSDSGVQCIVANNISAKNTNGFAAGGGTTNRFGKWFNNISIGNTTNWATTPSTLESASNNAGISTDTPWKTGSNATITVATTDFFSYGGASYASTDNFKPAVVSSPQVDSGLEFYGATSSDFIFGEVPNYNNGGSEARDVGCYEFDHGYGPHPASHVLTLTNVVVGSRVAIRDQANTTTHYDQIAAASTMTATITVYGDSRDNWIIRIRKSSAAQKQLPYETLMTATAGASSIYVSQVPDTIAS